VDELQIVQVGLMLLADIERLTVKPAGKFPKNTKMDEELTKHMQVLQVMFYKVR
jgi:hypothetical protein